MVVCRDRCSRKHLESEACELSHYSVKQKTFTQAQKIYQKALFFTDDDGSNGGENQQQ
jgi:hypothetical protein